MSLLRRAVSALIVIWLAVSLAFVTLRAFPGDAVNDTLGRGGASDEAIQARRQTLGLDRPLRVQYTDYLADLGRGDLGDSLISQQPVWDIIQQNAGPTLVLAFSALLIAMMAGVSLGLIAGIAPWWPVRASAEGVLSLALSTPVYWTATLAIYFFTIIFPVNGDFRRLILPALVLGFHTAGSIAQVTATSVRESAQQDYVRTARAKGLPDWDVLDHILRVGLLPVVAVIALQLGFLLGGTVITETIFVRRGLGRVLINAVNTRDYPVIQGLVVLSAIVYTVIHFLADTLYRILDPRVEV